MMLASVVDQEEVRWRPKMIKNTSMSHIFSERRLNTAANVSINPLLQIHAGNVLCIIIFLHVGNIKCIICD